MTDAALEHVNLTVSDPDRTAAMLAELFGWHVRWRGPAANGGHTIHVGSDRSYIAVYGAAGTTGADGGAGLNHRKGRPLNHVGVEVADLDDVERRVVAHGLAPMNHADYEPGRRFYFLDHDGIEFEVVSYTPAGARAG